MNLKAFLGSTLKVALAIVVSMLVLAAVGLAAWKIYENMKAERAKEFTVLKEWPVDMKQYVGMNVLAKTKVVDGQLLASVTFDGYPPYLSDPRLALRNKDAHFTFRFVDADGFNLFEQVIPLSDFVGVVDGAGEKAGMRHQFSHYLDVDTYKRFSNLTIDWNLETKIPAEKLVAVTPEPKQLDPCAPNLSRDERLKRLGEFGTVREIGGGTFAAGGHELTVMNWGALISCR